MLLDVVMPGMSGYDVCRALRADPRTAILPIVMVTAVDPGEERHPRARGRRRRFSLEAGGPGGAAGAGAVAAAHQGAARSRRGRRRASWRGLNATLEARVQAQVDELARLARLKRFFSPAVADVIVAGDAADPLRTHRAEVTVVCLALRGFTAFAESSEPEEVMAVLREFHAAMGRLVVAVRGHRRALHERRHGDRLQRSVPVRDAARRAVGDGAGDARGRAGALAEALARARLRPRFRRRHRPGLRHDRDRRLRGSARLRRRRRGRSTSPRRSPRAPARDRSS